MEKKPFVFPRKKALMISNQLSEIYLIQSMLNVKNSQKLTKELRLYDKNIIACHEQFNSFTSQTSLPTTKYLQKLHTIYDLDIFSLNSTINTNINPDIHLLHKQIRANYYSPSSFNHKNL